MFTHKDIENRSLFVINGLESQHLKMSNGRLMLEDLSTNKALTKLPIPKILSLMIIGHTTITTSVIEHCNKHGVPIVVMKPNFRPVFYFGNMAEANYLLRKKQYLNAQGVLEIAQTLIHNKIMNQICLLKKTRDKECLTAISKLSKLAASIPSVKEYRSLMGIEGKCANIFFDQYYAFAGWELRRPRVKLDYLNAILDIGYTMLFNYIECMLRLFGFDLYMGVYHQLWFRRKSLVCDIMEPMRCIIDHQIRKSLKYGTFKENDFEKRNNAFYLKSECRSIYTKVFFESILEHKAAIYSYVQNYYRCFMGRKSIQSYPIFLYE